VIIYIEAQYFSIFIKGLADIFSPIMLHFVVFKWSIHMLIFLSLAIIFTFAFAIILVYCSWYSISFTKDYIVRSMLIFIAIILKISIEFNFFAALPSNVTSLFQWLFLDYFSESFIRIIFLALSTNSAKFRF
jgi:hypothetical protein